MNINESSLSRVWQHVKDNNKTIVIFTAFRDEYEYKDNIKHNKAFAAELKKAGFGYFYVNGFFPENEGTDKEVNVKEDSIFAIGSGEKGKELISLCHKLANSRNQDSIIVKEPTEKKTLYYFLNKDGSKSYISEGLKVGKLGK
jgi:hypothetical protein